MLGATVAFCLAALAPTVTEYEAEDHSGSGVQIGPDRHFGTLAAEASGRRAVQLNDATQTVAIRLKHEAQGITIRYALPDSPAGTGIESAAIIEQEGRQVARARLTSRYAIYYGAYPFSNRPADGRAHHFWDEVRVKLPRPIPAGATLEVRPASGARAFAVDLIETEPLSTPERRPPGALSVLSFAADSSARRSSTGAFVRAIAVARRKQRPLYVPPGTYRVDGHLVVDKVTILGAGSWYSVISGHNLGFYSRSGGSTNVRLSGFAVESDVIERRDRLPLAAIGGTFSRSTFTSLYLHHAKVGLWLDGPAHDLAIRDVVIADQAADGINLHRGIRNALVEGNRIRNVGDDGIASWSDRIGNANIVIRGNRITAPLLANGIALYGGRNIEVSDNRISDTLTQGGGIHLGSRFRSVPFSGRIRISRNVITRAGSIDPNWHFGIGAIWLYALERPIDADILFASNRVEDAGCEAVQLLGPHRISGVAIDGLSIAGRVASVFALQSAGSLSVQNVVSEEQPLSTTVDVPAGLNLQVGAGNRGWTTRIADHPNPPRCL